MIIDRDDPEIEQQIANLVENILDDLEAEAALDEEGGPLDPRWVLLQAAARAIARSTLNYEVPPQSAIDYALGLAARIMMDAVIAHEERKRPKLYMVKS